MVQLKTHAYFARWLLYSLPWQHVIPSCAYKNKLHRTSSCPLSCHVINDATGSTIVSRMSMPVACRSHEDATSGNLTRPRRVSPSRRHYTNYHCKLQLQVVIGKCSSQEWPLRKLTFTMTVCHCLSYNAHNYHCRSVIHWHSLFAHTHTHSQNMLLTVVYLSIGRYGD